MRYPVSEIDCDQGRIHTYINIYLKKIRSVGLFGGGVGGDDAALFFKKLFFV